eukprot:TRINITY_DN3589_c0_g1_i2.p2 TRINITY_DN3589_c0_g1~~TRINITY_DN3589_c0_g1_i2.p2  ORF type:complete len:159 (+),score=17.15 TRINITY_DN3589_c0_g1_i2:375-851(+)
MAASSWELASSDYYGFDPDDQQSWQFKIEFDNNEVNLHQWKCSNKNYAILRSKNWGPAFGSDYYENGYYYGGYLYVYNNGKGVFFFSFQFFLLISNVFQLLFIRELRFIFIQNLLFNYFYQSKLSSNNDYYTKQNLACLLYTSPSPRDRQKSRMPSSA